MTSAADEGIGGVEILSKAGAVIDALAERGALSVNALAEAVDEPMSSTYRLLQSLVALRLVEPAPLRGMYRLGLSLLEVGSALEDSLDVRTVAMPIMRDLRAALDVAILVCYRRDLRAVCVERLEGHNVRLVSMQVGDSLPLHVGAAPRALLAWLPPGEQHAVLDELTSADSLLGFAVPPLSALRREIADIRRRGYSRSDEDVTLGVAALGSPIFNHRGELVAALSISGLRDQIIGRESEVSAALRRAAHSISAALGFEEPTND
ncbi:IclR family transcriptional regulator [Microbacterium protaetiae]|uniref:IclR family transcriptional regulator n=1 Tax=Microbacterium protaetiae TaxID=2509458 RepID=A0A4P6EBR6_9MICO|nr:IclR family transcriptional regulator [Microbacterium protaetiae]QAY59650.1 IclR family transcriptional regulator [Microbacterium protaetiae]